MCILCTPRPSYWSTYWLIVNRCIGWYINRHSADMLLNISIDTRPIDMLLDISIDTRPIYRPRCVGRHIGQYIGPALDWYVCRYMTTENRCLIVGWHVDWEATNIFADCNLRLIGRVSVDISANTSADQLTCRSREYQHFRWYFSDS